MKIVVSFIVSCNLTFVSSVALVHNIIFFIIQQLISPSQGFEVCNDALQLLGGYGYLAVSYYQLFVFVGLFICSVLLWVETIVDVFSFCFVCWIWVCSTIMLCA
jgi:hypothetical protein